MLKAHAPKITHALKLSALLGLALSVLCSGGYFLQFNDAVPSALRQFFGIVGLASLPGIVAGALFGGLVEGSPHGAKTFSVMLAFAIPLNFVLFTVVIFVATSLSRLGVRVLRRG